MNASVAIYKDGYLEQIDHLFAANKLSKIDFSDPDNIDAFVLREYSRLHLHLKGSHVFAERDQVWARLDMLPSRQILHTLFFIRHGDVGGLTGATTIHRHDAIITYEGLNAKNNDVSILKTKDSTLSANQLFNMPDFFFRPRFKGRAAQPASAVSRFRPSFERLCSIIGAKIGLQ